MASKQRKTNKKYSNSNKISDELPSKIYGSRGALSIQNEQQGKKKREKLAQKSDEPNLSIFWQNNWIFFFSRPSRDHRGQWGNLYLRTNLDGNHTQFSLLTSFKLCCQLSPLTTSISITLHPHGHFTNRSSCTQAFKPMEMTKKRLKYCADYWW